jgi:hypothetical protein
VVAIDVGHRIIIVVLHGLNILLWLDLNLLTIILIQHLWILFLRFNWGRNRVDDIIEVADVVLKLYDGILGLLKSLHVLLLHLTKLYHLLTN